MLAKTDRPIRPFFLIRNKIDRPNKILLEPLRLDYIRAFSVSAVGGNIRHMVE